MAINDPNYRYATHTWETDGVRIDYEISFDGGYLHQSDVVAFSVAVDPGTGQVSDRQTHALTFLSEVDGTATVRISPALPVGRRVVIYRSTEKGAALVNYAAGSVLTKANLDLANKQHLFGIAEIMDLINSVDARSDGQVQQIIDLYELSQLIYAQILELLAAEGITTVEPKFWEFTGNGVDNIFPIEGADITDPVFYDVFVGGAGIEPTDGFTVNIGMDTDASTLQLASVPANGVQGWVVLRGYARALNSDYLQTIINSPEFLTLLEQTITNTLYETTTVLRLGPLVSLIPTVTVSGTSLTADKSHESSLIRCTNIAATTVTIRPNNGSPTQDWTNTANSSTYFSVKQAGTGQVTIAPGAGYTLKVPHGFLPKTRGMNSIITATADGLAVGEWTLSGDLALDPAVSGAHFAKVLAAAHSNSTVTPTTPAGFVASLTAGRTYHVRMVGTYQTAATTTGCTFGIVGAGGLVGTIQGRASGAITNAAAATALSSAITALSGAGSTLTTTGVAVINTPHWVEFNAVVVCTASGTLSLSFASEVAASAAQLNAGFLFSVDEVEIT